MELLQEITEFLTEGMVDPREILAKSEPGPSDVHIPSAGKKKEKDNKWAKRIALGTSAIGVVSAPAAINAALKDPRLHRKSTDAERAAAKGIPLKIAEKIGLKSLANNKKVLTAGALGAAGLQIANPVGDAISTKYFANEEKKRRDAKKSVSKLLEARASGAITTEEALSIVEKSIKAKQYTAGERALDGLAAQNTKQGKVVVLLGTGILSGAGGAYAIDRAVAHNKQYRNPKIVPKVNVSTARFTGEEGVIGKHDLEWSGEVSKVDTEKRQVFGWCSLSKVDGEDVIDRQGDYIPLDEVEKSAYDYVIHSRKGGDMHKRDGDAPLHTSDLIESFVVTPEKLEQLGLDRDAVPHGWWVGFKVNDDEQWEKVKKGERNHFSIHGKGKRRTISKSMRKKPLTGRQKVAIGVGGAAVGSAAGGILGSAAMGKLVTNKFSPALKDVSDSAATFKALVDSDDAKQFLHSAAAVAEAGKKFAAETAPAEKLKFISDTAAKAKKRVDDTASRIGV